MPSLLWPLLLLLAPIVSPSIAMASPPIKTVLVTGANGYLGSHIVQLLLEKGYDVRACVRDAANASSVDHLLRIPTSSTGALTLFSTGDLADDSSRGRYDEPLVGADAVVHAASPLRPKMDGGDGLRDVLAPGMSGTHEILDAILARPSVRRLVLTSSMSAAAPTPEPEVKDESHWSDDAAQLSRQNYYGCLKTRQERLCHEWVQTQKDKGALQKDFRFSAICPTMILGPPVGAGRGGHSYVPSGTMGTLHRWMTGGRTSAPNDSMSFVHVRDCAAMHVAALERSDASGRYFSLVESWHWNDILTTLKDLYPTMPLEASYKYVGDDLVDPTTFDSKRMNSLGVQMTSVKEILAESVAFLKDVGSLK
ncbi:hypothetical protein ACHAWF_001255 [Thalassiosira exigua]